LDRKARDAEWSDWMRAAIAGDGVAYQQLLTELSRSLRLLVRRGFSGATVGAGDVEDVVQEVMLAVHLKRHTWDQAKPITPWIVAIARNKMIDELRRRGRKAEVPIEPLIDQLEAGGAEDGVNAHDVARLLNTLPERQREIVRSISIDGQSARDVAVKLGMSEVAVRVSLHRSLKALAHSYSETKP
jgi:RNA polymerase sigma-70 factor (ECF subfamily)